MLDYAISNTFPIGESQQTFAFTPSAALNVGDRSDVPSLRAFSPQRIMTDVRTEGVCTILGYFTPSHPDSSEILGEFDGWVLSHIFWERQLKAFLTEHGLNGKNDQEIDRYLARRKLSLPSSPRLYLPPIEAGRHISISARCSEPVIIALLGSAV